jgi:NitT/TauT family transport system ATP-binding protein
VDVTVIFVTHDLDEAVLLGDRILVLGANPSAILELLENPVPRPRRPAQALTPEFLATKRRVEELIHGLADEPPVLPRIRLTEVGDEVE